MFLVCGEWGGILGQNSGIHVIVTIVAMIAVKGEVTVTLVMWEGFELDTLRADTARKVLQPSFDILALGTNITPKKLVQIRRTTVSWT